MKKKLKAIDGKYPILPNIVFTSFLICSIAQYIFGSLIVRERYIVGGFFLLLLLFFRKIPTKIKGHLVFLIIVSVLGCLLTAINHGYYSILYLLYTCIHLSIVLLMFKEKISGSIPLLIFYIFFCFVMFRFAQLENINEIFPESSRNAVSWIGIVLCALYYLLSILNNKNLKNPIPLFVLFVLCVFSQGRSGIIVSLVLLMSHYIFNYSGNIKIWLQTSKNILLLIIFIAIAFIFSGKFIENLEYLQDRKLEDEGRQAILNSYCASIDYISLFTGVKAENVDILAKFHHNPHNSYIACHIKFGIMAFILFGYLLVAIVKGAANRHLYFLTSIYGCILLRIFTDRLAFIGNFDFIIYFTPILIYQKARSGGKSCLRNFRSQSRFSAEEHSMPISTTKNIKNDAH